MLCFLATKAHELPLSTSLSILYFSVIDFEASFLLCPSCNILPSINVLSCYQPTKKHHKKALHFVRKSACIAFNTKSSNSNFFLHSISKAIAMKSHLNGDFCSMDPKKLVPLSESPTYSESQLSSVFLVKFSNEVQGTTENSLN